MRAVLQRVTKSSVSVEGEPTGAIEHGWLVLLGVHRDDTDRDIAFIVDKCLNLRGFSDAEGKMNLSALDTKAGLLVVSQFTLYADVRKGRRPGFSEAAPPDIGERQYLKVVQELQKSGLVVATGKFQSHMTVSLINDGPVTFIIDSREGH